MTCLPVKTVFFFNSLVCVKVCSVVSDRSLHPDKLPAQSGQVDGEPCGPCWLTAGPCPPEGWCPALRSPPNLLSTELRFSSANIISTVTFVFTEGGEPSKNKTQFLPWRKGSIYIFVKTLLRSNSHTVQLIHLKCKSQCFFFNIFTELCNHHHDQF